MQPISNVIWFLTDRCNSSCRHCAVSGVCDPCVSGELSEKEIQKAIINVASWGVKRIHFLGGEPTIRNDFFEILDTCKKVGIATSFNTNAKLIDKYFARELVRNNCYTITFSFDGIDEHSNDYIRGMGSFRKSLEAIEYIKSERSRNGELYPPMVYLELGLNKSWSNKINKLEDFVNQIQPECINLEYTLAEGNAKECKDEIVLSEENILDLMPELVIPVYKTQKTTPYIFRFFPKWVEYGNIVSGTIVAPAHHRCVAYPPQSWISGDGRVVPCNYTPKALGWDNVPNAITSTLEEVTSSFHYKQYLTKRHQGTINLPSVCKECGYSKFICEMCPVSPQSEREKGTKTCKEAIRRIELIKSGK